MNTVNENHNDNLEKKELVRLWTEMGASTGSLLGRLIGAGAVFGLEVMAAINRPLMRGLANMGENIEKEHDKK